MITKEYIFGVKKRKEKGPEIGDQGYSSSNYCKEPYHDESDSARDDNRGETRRLKSVILDTRDS